MRIAGEFDYYVSNEEDLAILLGDFTQRALNMLPTEEQFQLKIMFDAETK